MSPERPDPATGLLGRLDARCPGAGGDVVGERCRAAPDHVHAERPPRWPAADPSTQSSCQIHSSLPVTPMTDERTSSVAACGDLVEVADVRLDACRARRLSPHGTPGPARRASIDRVGGVPEAPARSRPRTGGRCSRSTRPDGLPLRRWLEGLASHAPIRPGPARAAIAITPRSRSATRSSMLPAVGLPLAALDHRVPQLGGELGGVEPGPRRQQRRAEVVEHVRHAALAAGEVEGQHRPVDRPTQPGPVGDRQVDLLDGRLPVRPPCAAPRATAPPAAGWR